MVGGGLARPEIINTTIMVGAGLALPVIIKKSIKSCEVLK
jgi:hypothetical protein